MVNFWLYSKMKMNCAYAHIILQMPSHTIMPSHRDCKTRKKVENRDKLTWVWLVCPIQTMLNSTKWFEIAWIKRHAHQWTKEMERDCLYIILDILIISADNPCTLQGALCFFLDKSQGANLLGFRFLMVFLETNWYKNNFFVERQKWVIYGFSLYAYP